MTDQSIADCHPESVERGWMTCKIPGCETIVRSRWGTLCNKHYFRGRRTGSFEERAKAGPGLNSRGYLVSQQKSHPASSKSGHLYEHRKVFYETRGPDGHSCFWCDIPLVWKGKSFDKLCIDHLNGDKANNSPDNLVPSCHRCNIARGCFFAWVIKHKDDPFLQKLFAKAVVCPM